MQEITDVKEIQGVLLDGLKYFKSICEKNNLKYFLSNGTLIGAVKYGKFVPWDDDIDVLMPREDYNKLLSLVDVNNDRYKLISPKTTPKWRSTYAKLSDTTTILEETGFNLGLEVGIAIDIFPIDKWSSCKYRGKMQAFYYDFLKRLLILANADYFATDKSGIKKIILKSMHCFANLIGRKRLQKKIIKKAEKSYKYKDKFVGCVIWTCHSSKEVLPKEVFEKADYATFCGDTYPIPIDYKQYLSNLYGNWEQELPLEKQKSNHKIKAWWKNNEK